MLTVYVSLVFVGVIVLGISLLFGADHDMEHDFDAGHDFEADHDIHIDHEADAAVMSPSKFSIKLIMAFLVGFGFGGVLGLKALGLENNLSLVSAFPAALIFYYVAYRILKWLYLSQITSHIYAQDLVGSEAIVINTITPGGIGEIKAEHSKTRQSEYFQAKGKSAKDSFAKEESVKIVNYIAGIFEVEKIPVKKQKK